MACPPSITSWTISTLFGFYITFPYVMSWLRSLPSHLMSKVILKSYLYQLLVPLPLIVIVDYYMELSHVEAKFTFPLTYWPVTSWPVSRFPVFVMGVAAALNNETLEHRLKKVQNGTETTLVEDGEHTKKEN